MIYRMELWSYLKQLGSLMTAPWLVIGDFNQVLHADKKWGGRRVNMANAERLREVVDACSWIDLGFQGPRYTWTNRRKWIMNIRERIDSVT